ncbi:FAD-binding oxidoreductase [Piscinibacterium candidicorallinum]|uniref:D-lactate dehydrogenase (cytochrome) n=1 Tax=Piscinibacterium candidicorallinum TaxID=1793872 RepID=A0ABV7GXB2_9BURK
MNAPLPLRTTPPLTEAFLAALTARFADQASTAQAVREHHGRDESPFPLTPPDAVVFARSTQDIADCVKLCAAHAVPVVPYGAGSSLEGNFLAVQGGVCIDVSQMNAILAINAEDLTATVQAGVTRKQLNEALKDTGLFFPIDPGADASLGGMSATRASGTNAVRYGTMRENVLGLTVVTPAGEVIHTARRARKSSAGYDLTRLYVGSEGTLGVIAEVTVKLYPQPEAISAAVCTFPSVDDAVATTIEIIQMGVPIARCEILDANAVAAVNKHDQLTLPEQPMLLFEFHGSPASVREQAETVQAIAAEHGGGHFEWAEKPEDRSRLWKARHNAYFALLQMKPGCRAVTTDTCVPISRLAECFRETVADCERLKAEHGIPYGIVGHVGDGNFHVLMLCDPDKPEERDWVEAVNDRLVQRALDLDGTCTGEHGVGLHKIDFLVKEHGDATLDVMRAIKRALDPQNLMNPGKILRL